MTTQKLFQGRFRARSVAAALALAAGTLFSIGAGVTLSTDANAAPPVTSTQPDTQAIQLADSLSAAFRNAASRISPAVVNISTVDEPDTPSASADRGGSRAVPQIPEEFRRFFGDQFGQGQTPFGMQPMPSPERRGQGSGVVMRQDGYILTNNHVIEGADEITVRFDDGRELTGSIVGADPESDLAVIKVQATGLTVANFGDSEALQPGDWVVAVGNPFGLDHTVTAGVVSAVGRGDMGINTFEDFIQTDAAINPGNSGGPMINLHGEVVGINSAIKSASGGNNGIGFAIPAKLAMNVADALIEHGSVQRGWLGVSIQPLTPELASSFGYSGTRGALIAQVVDDTPASRAGVEPGDIVVRIDDRPVGSPRELINTIAMRDPGEQVTLTVERAGAEKSLEVKLGERPGARPVAAAGKVSPNVDDALGMQVQPLDAALAQQLGVEATRGLVITRVDPGSPAAEAGLRPEDIILEAGREPVTTPRDLADRASEAQDGLLLRIQRGTSSLFIAIKPAS